MFTFCFVAIEPFLAEIQQIPYFQIPELQFDLENSRSKVKAKVTLVSVASGWLISFLFHINWTIILKIWQEEYSIGKKTHLKFHEKYRYFCFLAFRWAVLTLSWEQVKICPDSVTWWPWPKFKEMGSNFFSHTNRLTSCDLKKLATGDFPESWKLLAERRRRLRKRTQSNKFSAYLGRLD